jgi:hypothetical protein
LPAAGGFAVDVAVGVGEPVAAPALLIAAVAATARTPVLTPATASLRIVEGVAFMEDLRELGNC